MLRVVSIWPGNSVNDDRAGGAFQRVLMVNKFHYPRGGAEHYMFRLAGLLEGRGARVDYFAMHDARNLPCDTDRYFVSEVDFEHPPKGVRGRARRGRPDGLLAGGQAQDGRPCWRIARSTWRTYTTSTTSCRPRCWRRCTKRGIPVVMTVHDFKLVCPVYSLLSNGQICERCVG